MQSLLRTLLLGVFFIGACAKNSSVQSDGNQNANPPGPVEAIKSLSYSCQELKLSSTTLTYCTDAHVAKNWFLTEVVYFFHGIGGSAEVLFRPPYSDFVASVKQALGSSSPIFVGLSLGPEGVLKENALEVIANAIPLIEKNIHRGIFVRRHLVGESMGAYNSLRLAAAAPSTFKSLSLLCPALVAIDPNDPAQVQKYIEDHQAVLDPNLFKYIWGFYKKEFPTSEVWEANNPFNFLEKGRYDRLRFFISIGRSDSIGFYDGASSFRDIAQSRMLRVNWAPVEGAHCSFDPQALGKFVFSQL